MIRAGAARVDNGGKRQPSWWGTCQRCWGMNWLSWCHVFTRAIHRLRWDSDNAWAWCAGCHRYLDQHWEEKRAWVIAQIGESAFDRLSLAARVKGASRLDRAAIAIEIRQRTGG